MELKGKSICVTGSSGFIPTHLIKALKKENPASIHNLDLKTGFNLCEFREVEEYLIDTKPDIVFHMATLPLPMSLNYPYKVVNDIIKMTLNLCELQKQGYFKRLVQMSSSEAYGNAQLRRESWTVDVNGERYDSHVMDESHSLEPRTPYASAKASCDLIALSYHQTFGSDIIIPRSYNAYGPGQSFTGGAVIPKTINNILNKEKPVICKNGKQTRDFVYVKDIAKAVVAISKIETTGIVVNIGTGIETSIAELVYLICDIMGYKGGIDWQNSRQGDVTQHCADNSKLYELTGYIPDTLLEDGLKETIKYYVDLHSAKTVHK